MMACGGQGAHGHHGVGGQHLVSNSLKNGTCFVSNWLTPCTMVSYVQGEMDEDGVVLLPGPSEQGVME